MKRVLIIVGFGMPSVLFGQIFSIASGDWSNSATWDCGCVPTSADDVIIRHEVTVSSDQQANYLVVSNENALSPTDDALLTISNGALLEITNTIMVVSENNTVGGQHVGFFIEGDGTRVEAGAFYWIRDDSRSGTEMTFRMRDDCEFIVNDDFYFQNNDDTSSETSIDFMMGSNSGLSPADESPYLFVGGDVQIAMDKASFDSYLSILIRERSRVEVAQNFVLSINNAPNDSDIYLYLADLPSRSTPGTDNLIRTFSQLKVHGQFVMELPFISNTTSPDIRADIRGNAVMEVGGFQMNYLNGNGIGGGTGDQDIDFYMFDQASLTILGDLQMTSELQTPTFPSISNNLLFLQDDSYALINGNVVMRAHVDHVENRLAMDGAATLEVKGNFDRNDGSPGSSYVTEGRLQLAGSSTVVLSGSGVQTIPWAYLGHYQNLTINNTSGDMMPLEGDVRINQHLEMQNGYLQSEFSPNSSNDDTFYVIDFLPTATANLGSENSFITGRVRLTDRNGSGSQIHLPLGTKNESLEIWAPITFNSFDVAVNGSVYVSHVYEEPLYGSLVGALLGINQFEYWEIGRSSSGVWASGEILDNASVTLYWTDACYSQINDYSFIIGSWLDNNGTISNLTDDKWHADTESNSMGDNCGEGTGFGEVTFFLTNSNRTRALTVGTSDPSVNPLPIDLSSFSAKINEQYQVVLDWMTNSELNNDYFILAHSLNGVDFSEIGKVKGAGTSQTPTTYTFDHQTPTIGINYYQITQVDYDGSATMLGTVVIDVDSKFGNEFKVLPNPIFSGDSFRLIFDSYMICDCTLQLIQLNGQIFQHSYLKRGVREIVLDGGIPSGFYLIKVKGECIDKEEKIIIK